MNNNIIKINFEQCTGLTTISGETFNDVTNSNYNCEITLPNSINNLTNNSFGRKKCIIKNASTYIVNNLNHGNELAMESNSLYFIKDVYFNNNVYPTQNYVSCFSGTSLERIEMPNINNTFHCPSFCNCKKLQYIYINTNCREENKHNANFTLSGCTYGSGSGGEYDGIVLKFGYGNMVKDDYNYYPEGDCSAITKNCFVADNTSSSVKLKHNNIVIPKNIEKIDDNAFVGNYSNKLINRIRHIVFNGSKICQNTGYTFDEINNDGTDSTIRNIFKNIITNEGLDYPGSITIKNCEKIGAFAFSNLNYVNSITIEANTSDCELLSGMTNDNTEAGPFFACEGDKPYYKPVNKIEFKSSNYHTIKIGNFAFYNLNYAMYQVNELTLCEGITEIGVEAFENQLNIENFVFPSTLSFIGMDAFGGWKNGHPIVKQIICNSSATTIDLDADNCGPFYGCHNSIYTPIDVYVPDSSVSWYETNWGNALWDKDYTDKPMFSIHGMSELQNNE